MLLSIWFLVQEYTALLILVRGRKGVTPGDGVSPDFSPRDPGRFRFRIEYICQGLNPTKHPDNCTTALAPLLSSEIFTKQHRDSGRKIAGLVAALAKKEASRATEASPYSDAACGVKFQALGSEWPWVVKQIFTNLIC